MEQLPFDKHYQQHFLNHLLRDSDFLLNVVDDVKPELFSDHHYQKIVRLILDFRQDHGSAPGTLIFRVLDSWKDKGSLSEPVHSALTTILDEFFGLPLQNKTFLLAEFSRFARQQMAKSIMIPFMEDVKKGNFESAEQLMRELFLYRPSSKLNLGRRLDPNPTARVIRRLQEDVDRCWTLIPELDSRIDGLRGGELGVFLSQRSSIGKSAALQFLARSLVFQGKKVLIYTLEMSEEAYEDRLDQCIAGLTRKELTNSSVIGKHVQRMFKTGGDIWIAAFPPYMTTVSHLRDHCAMIQNAMNFHADVLIIDYADLLLPESNNLRGDLYGTGAEVYGNLLGWLREENMPCWTVSQSSRAAGEAEFADQHHMGQSIAKIQLAHLAISINRSDEEVKNFLTSLVVIKNREGPARYKVQIKTDFARMAFWSRDGAQPY